MAIPTVSTLTESLVMLRGVIMVNYAWDGKVETGTAGV
jgi:hypothetical protein